MKTFLLKILPVIALIIMSSCAATPSAKEMREEVANYNLPKNNDDKKTLVYIVRPSKIGGTIRFNVFVDNKENSAEVGYTRGNQFIYFFVEPGSHTIFSKAENWADIEIEGKPKETIFIKQIPEFGIVMTRNSLEQINEIKAKYYIKHGAVGTIIK